MTSRKEIDVIVNAGVKGQRNLQAIPKTISELEAALDRQTAAAKRGENSIDELKATLMSLQEVRTVLDGSKGLVGNFQKLSTQIEASEAKVRETTKAYDEYKTKVGDIGSATDAQVGKLQKLAARQDRAVQTLAKQREQYAALADTMREAGISTENLAESERAALQAAAQLGIVINKNQQAIASYANDVRTARDATKQLEEASKLSSQRLDQFLRQKATEAANQAKTLADLKNDIIARSEASARDLGLQKAADEADGAARKFTSLARASKDLSPRVVSLREALGGIITPTNDVTRTLSGVESEVKRLSDSIGQIKGPVKDYQQSMADLKNAQKALTTQASLIDNFRRQADALRTSRTEFVQARAEVAQYAAKVREGGEAGQSFVNALAASQGRLRSASEALRQQLTVTQQARTALREAGISTRDLAGEQGRLTDNAKASAAAVRQLGDAVQKYGQESEKGRKGGGPFGGGDGERTTLNFAQRLRGQILSLTAAYVGLFQAINTAKGALDAMVSQQAIESRLAVATESNDPAVIGKEFEYLRGRADYYGVGIKNLADSYGSYAIAAKSAQFSNEQTKYTFEQLTGGMRVLKLNTDQQGRAWAQLQQILSKTKPEMEDIKTIAEAGFAGVQGMMARGLQSIGVAGVRAGSEVSDMFKLMKEGSLSSGQAIYALAVQAEKELGMRVPQAIRTLQAEQGRFETATFEFQKAIAESGWAEAYTAVLVKLREMMQSEDGERTAKAIGSAFKALADVLILAIDNMDTLLTISKAFLALWAANKLTGAIEDFQNMRKEVDLTGGSMTKLQKGFLLFKAAVVGWSIGTWAQENFSEVRQYGIYLVTSLDMAWVTVKHGFMAAFEVLPNFFGNIMRGIANAATSGVRVIGSTLARLASAVGLDDIANALNQGVAAMTLTYNNVDAVIANRRTELNKDLAAIRKIRDEMLVDELTPKVKASASPNAAVTGDGTTSRPGKPKSLLTDDDKKGEAAAKKRLAEIDEIRKALESLTAKTDRAQVESLESQLKAVDAQYASLSRKIKDLGGKEGAEFAKQFSEGLANLKGTITENFNKKLLSEQEALQKKLEDAEVASGRRSTTNLDARLKAVADRYAQTYRDIEAYRQKLEANGRDPGAATAMKDRLDGEVKTLQNMERQKFIYDELRRFENEMGDLLQARAAQIKAASDLQEASLITDEEARNRTQMALTTMQPQIDALALKAQEFAMAIGAGFDPARLQQFIATIQLGATSMGRFGKEVSITAAQVNDKLATGLTNTFGTAIDGIAQAVAGQKSWSDAIKGTARAFLQFASDFLREIAMMIAKRLILKSLEGTGIGGFIASLAAPVKHSGGVIGHAGGRSRNVSAAWFANAPRYHTGGVAGLSADEYPTILQRGEEVLAADSPRNIMNGGAGLGGAQPQREQGLRFVFVDDRSKVAEAMASAEGDKVIVEAIRRNAASVRTFVR